MMKYLLYIISAIALFLCVGCAADRSPRSLAKHFYGSIASAKYEKALAYTTLADNVDIELYYAVMDKVSRSIESKGGVEKIEIVDEKMADDGQRAVVTVQITYANGDVAKEYCDVVCQDEKWIVDVELYSK